MCFIANFRALPQEARSQELERRITDNAPDLLDSPQLSGEMANTNADGWDIETTEFDIENVTVEENQIRVPIDFTASGDQADNTMFLGRKITGTAEAVISEDGSVIFQDIVANLVDE